MKPFEDKVVLITGASSGIGAAAARRFARDGAKVVIAARRKDQGEAVARELERLGGQGHFVQTDVSKSSDVKALVSDTIRKFGRLDCAVNNAGITGQTQTPIADVDEATWDQVMSVNVKAIFLGMKHQIPAMLKSGGGAIVNIASIYGSKPSDVGHAAYCASKHAVIGLSKTTAIDYATRGIRINTVSPGFTHSEMIDPLENSDFLNTVIARHSAQNRLGNGEEVANAIAWLCSDAASFVNGTDVIVDGGSATKLY